MERVIGLLPVTQTFFPAPANDLHIILLYFQMALWSWEVLGYIGCGRLAEVKDSSYEEVVMSTGVRPTSGVDTMGSPMGL